MSSQFLASIACDECGATVTEPIDHLTAEACYEAMGTAELRASRAGWHLGDAETLCPKCANERQQNARRAS